MRGILFYITLLFVLGVTDISHAANCKIRPVAAANIAVKVVDCTNMDVLATSKLKVACRFYKGWHLADLANDLPPTFLNNKQHAKQFKQLIRQSAALKSCHFAGKHKATLTFVSL